MKLADIRNEQERAAALVKLHQQWTPTMKVSVWGRGKATRDDKKCRDAELSGHAKYQGDCDNCDFFMGARFAKKSYAWGDYAPACCALDLEALPTPEAPC